jgi:hypothetical protein
MESIFPVLSPTFVDEKDRDIKARMEDFYNQSITINQSYWTEADIDVRFECGEQSVWNDFYTGLPNFRRRNFCFNRIRRIVNMISGYQRRNRMSTIVTPRENSDQETSDQFSKVIAWVNQQENVYETISEAFHDSVVTGMNLLQVWVDYRSDPISGNIRVDNCPYNTFLIDPFFKKPDLSDCNAIWKRSYLTRDECISLAPDHEEMISSLSTESTRDGKFQYTPESFNYGMRNLLTYDEYYYKDTRKQKLLIDTKTGETQEWKSSNEDSLREFLRMYPSIIVSDQTIPTVSVAILINGKTTYDGPQMIGIDKYPFVPVFAYYTPQTPYYSWRIQGVVRGLRDAQYLYNRRKAIELDILESQVTSGFIYKENALVNPKDVFLSGQGRGVALKADAQITDVQQIVAPQIPPSMIQLSELLGKEIQEISGVNEELLGSAMDEKAGILAMLRQGAGLTTLQTLFDNLNRAQKILGDLTIDIIQSNFTPGKIKRIIEQEPSQQFYNKSFGKYDAVVEEGLNTSTQKQMQFAQLLQLKEIGVLIPDDVILEAVTLQNKKQLVDRIKQMQEQNAQMQQQAQQAQTQEIMARTELAQARAKADTGLGLERVSRIEENKELANERKAQANRDDQASLLDTVKALKEIDSMDIEHIERLVGMLNMVKQDINAELKPIESKGK